MTTRYFPSLLFVCIGLLALPGCKKDKFGPTTNEDGLTRDITDLVPQSILDEMETLGMPINGGTNPPDIEETYLASAFILLESNRPGDTPGMNFSDYYVTFSDQDSEELTLKVDYRNGGETGSGLGSFIVGDDCSFSVFVEVDSEYFGTEATLVHVISGELTEGGINNLHFANFMLDNNGNPNGTWIEEGEGRVIYDQDGFSPQQGTRSLGCD
ncbi:hypothetical protein [Lewinella sp. IMCC34183]|uniref:hypothetical protein n=1 Tax=Lewinella sp. IMCC34183 TaxID=2248762 RepID=UPI000E268E3F|nr:hypothetical protein [Lewinella sp. IMCC34183]